VKQTKSFGDLSMLGSPNLHRGNVPLATRLKIHDLHAQLAPIERYGVGDMSFAITGVLRALVRESVARSAAAPILAAMPRLSDRALTSCI
jgi:hypothetical protein